jgi:hypothetical protein
MTTRSWRSAALILVVVLAWLSYPSLVAAQEEDDPDSKAYRSYTLTMPKYKKYVAAMVNIAKAGQTNPKAENALEAIGESSIDESIAHLDRIPEVRRGITDAGLTTRDFVLVLGASLQAEMTNRMIKEQKMSPDAALEAFGASREQLAFMQKNEEEIARLNKEAKAKVTSPKKSKEKEAGVAE